ncbi:hypothetical protein HMPREF0346_3110 [Enterococcus faecalis EnGen0297]|nr:hypothetical protein HMPREF0346_3110 [Enterococcus faecalis EnGen0297]
MEELKIKGSKTCKDSNLKLKFCKNQGLKPTNMAAVKAKRDSFL